MKQQILSPGVQDGEEAELCAEMLRIGADGEQGFRGGAEQNAVENVLVVEGEFGNLFGQREDDVKVFDGQQLRPACFRATGRVPDFGTWGNGDFGRSCRRYACIGQWPHSFDVPAQRSRAAGLDGAHNAKLRQRQRTCRTVSCAVLVEKCRPLRERLAAPARYFCGWGGLLLLAALFFLRKHVEWAGGGGDDLRRDARVTGGGLDAAVAEQHLNDARIGALFQQVRGEAVPQNVRRDPLSEAALLSRVAAGLRDGWLLGCVFRAPGGKQPTRLIRPQRAIVTAQNRQQARRQHRIAVFLAFALFDAQQHALGIDVAHLQRHRFRDPQTGTVAQHQSRAVFQAGHVFEILRHFSPG